MHMLYFFEVPSRVLQKIDYSHSIDSFGKVTNTRKSIDSLTGTYYAHPRILVG